MAQNLFSLEGKNAWITGASYGIGFNIAKAFVAAGIKTIIVPSAFMRLCTSAQRLVPIPLLMPIVARQQKKKLG